MFAGLKWTDHKDVLGLNFLPLPNRTIAQLKCLAPPNRSGDGFKGQNTQCSWQHYTCILADYSCNFCILKKEKEYVSCWLHSVCIIEMCSFAFTHIFFFSSQFIRLLFTHCTLVFIQTFSLSACNNVNLFITAMEQGKHLYFLCYIGKS